MQKYNELLERSKVGSGEEKDKLELEILRFQEKMIAPYIENRIKNMFREKITIKTSFSNRLCNLFKKKR